MSVYNSLCIRTCDSQRVQETRLAIGLLCQHTKDPFTANVKLFISIFR